MTIVFEVAAPAGEKGRSRFTGNRGRSVRTFTPAATVAREKAITATYRQTAGKHVCKMVGMGEE